MGLNTRVGVARFISFLVQNVGSDIKPFINSLVKVLFPAVEREIKSRCPVEWAILGKTFLAKGIVPQEPSDIWYEICTSFALGSKWETL